MSVLALDTMLCVRDLDRSVVFYRDVLGFEVGWHWPWIATLELAGHRVYLFTESEPTEDRPATWLFPQAEAGRGSVILVLSVDDCEAAYEEVRARGGRFLTPPPTPPWGGRRCVLYDPDGFVELEEPAAATIASLPREEEVVDRLVAQGLATPARGDLRELPPPSKRPPGAKLPSETLEGLRSDERCAVLDVAHLDSSAIVKTVVEEPESGALRAFLQRYATHASAEPARAEVIRAVRRADPAAPPGAYEALDRLVLVAPSGRARRGRSPRSAELRTPAAAHLAAACTLAPQLGALVTYDSRLHEAAVTLALPVEAPA